MGAKNSVTAIALTTFEILNEILISIGAGILGITILTYDGFKNSNFAKTALITAITVASLIYVFRSTDMEEPNSYKVIFITGCDSGLGFSLAQHAYDMGFTVLAGCLNLDSEGASQLRMLKDTNRLHHVEIDITRSTSIEVAVEFVENFLETSYELWAVVNNAGVMIFGEFEWLTERQILHQMNVNLTGTLRLTKAFCPLLRRFQCRLITISSHCALATLPGLAVYGATKAALAAWSDGLRVELGQYGVNVITFIPGSFIQHSNIMGNQVENFHEMFLSFTPEQIVFYNDYFHLYTAYLSLLSGQKPVTKIDEPSMYKKFEKALLEVPPKTVYMHQPFRYSIYHAIFKYSPVSIRDYFITKFTQMPQYSSVTSRPELVYN